MEAHVSPLKRLAAIVAAGAAAAMLALACATTALAEEVTYPLWVGGAQVTPDNASDVFGDGTVAFDADTLTLTLTDATIECAELPESLRQTSGWVAIYGIMEGFNDPLTIKLVGDNTIVYDGAVAKDGYCVLGIYSTNQRLISSAEEVSPTEFAPAYLMVGLDIAGEGTLSIELAPIEGYAEYVEAKIEAYESGSSPSVSMPRPSALYGIYGEYSTGALCIEAPVSIAAGSLSEMSGEFLAGAYGNLRIMDTQVDVVAGNSLYENVGLYGDVTVSGESVVNVETGFGGYVYGALGNFDIRDNATVTVLGGKAFYYSIGASIYESAIIGGNAAVTFASAGIGALPGMSDWVSDESQSFGMYGDCYISDDATFIATGQMGAICEYNPGGFDFSYHNTGGAIVSEDWGLAPAGTSVWDGTSNLVTEAGGSGYAYSPYRYVRIPGTPLASRIAGDYANETAGAISKAAFPGGSEWVVIARDDDFADALGATGLAGTLKCPIVLTDRMALSEAAAAEIVRLGATNAYVIGGTGAIKEQVDTDLEALGVTKVERVWGENSYDTSLECAKKIVELGGDDESVAIAMSTNFQDALSFSPIAYKYGLPVILQTWGDTSADRGFTDEAAAWLAGKELTVVGGPGAISDASVEGYELFKRVYGETGYDTSNEIAKWATAGGFLSPNSVVIACGAQAPKGVDALAGAALAGKLGCPVLLVSGNDAMEEINTVTIDGYLKDNASKVLDVYVLGGGYVIPQDVVDKIEALFEA